VKTIDAPSASRGRVFCRVKNCPLGVDGEQLVVRRLVDRRHRRGAGDPGVEEQGGELAESGPYLLGDAVAIGQGA
jgi:hypothetical protein